MFEPQSGADERKCRDKTDDGARPVVGRRSHRRGLWEDVEQKSHPRPRHSGSHQRRCFGQGHSSRGGDGVKLLWPVADPASSDA